METGSFNDILKMAEGGLIHQLVLRNLFCRNTKASIGSDYCVPPYEEEVKFLEFSEVERYGLIAVALRAGFMYLTTRCFGHAL